MQDTRAFAPFYRVTNLAGSQTGGLIPSVTVAATAGGANASGQLPGSPAGPAYQIQIANAALTAWAFVNFGKFGSLAAATVASSYPVPPLGVVVVTVDSEVDGASVILSAGTGNVTFTRGAGV